jgi:3-phenylpropionate/cinnamic acid dioxygenase small subunit
MTEAATDAGLRSLLDERVILHTLHRYLRALDDGLEDEWLDVFTDDAVYDTFLPDGSLYVRLTTRQQFVDFLVGYPRAPVVAPKHVMVDPFIEIDGDEARVEATWLYLKHEAGGAPSVAAWGRYRDRLRREGSMWRIAERVCLTEAV